MARRSDRAAMLEAELERARADAATLRETIGTLTATNASLQSALEAMQAAFADQKVAFEKTVSELQALQRRLFRKKSEKLPPPEKALAQRNGEQTSAEQTQTKRRDRAEQRNDVEVREEKVRISDKLRRCPQCGREHLKNVGEGRTVSILDYVPGYFVRTEYSLETLAATILSRQKARFAPSSKANTVRTSLLTSLFQSFWTRCRTIDSRRCSHAREFRCRGAR